MPFYEGVFIARQDLSSAQVDQISDQMTQVLTDGGGRVAKKEYWGLKNLSYRINKNRKGHYVMFQMEAPSAAKDEMERQLRINEDILRYMTVKIAALEEGPSIMMQAKSSRDDRRGGRGGRDRGGRGERGERGDRDRGERGERGDGPRAETPRAETPRAETPRAEAAPADASNQGDKA